MATSGRVLLLNGVGLLTIPGWFWAFDTWLHPSVWAWHVSVTIAAIAVCLMFHETLHYAAIRVAAPAAQVRYAFYGANPSVRIEGSLSTRARLIFLLTPVIVISLITWAIATLAPIAAVTCVIVATTNAASSTADLWRSGEVILEAYRNRVLPDHDGSRTDRSPTSATSTTSAMSPAEGTATTSAASPGSPACTSAMAPTENTAASPLRIR